MSRDDLIEDPERVERAMNAYMEFEPSCNVTAMRAALDAAGPVVVERPAGSPFSPEEIEALLWATDPYASAVGTGLEKLDRITSARAKLEDWRS